MLQDHVDALLTNSRTNYVTNKMHSKGVSKNKIIYIRGPLKHIVDPSPTLPTPVLAEHEVMTLQARTQVKEEGESAAGNATPPVSVGHPHSNQAVLQHVTSDEKTSQPAVHRVRSLKAGVKRGAVTPRQQNSPAAKRPKKGVKHSRHSDIFT